MSDAPKGSIVYCYTGTWHRVLSEARSGQFKLACGAKASPIILSWERPQDDYCATCRHMDNHPDCSVDEAWRVVLNGAANGAT